MRSLAFAVLAVLAGCTFERVPVRPDADTTDAMDATPMADCPAGYGPINGIGMYRPVEGGGADRSWQAAAVDCNDDDDDAGGPYRRFTHLVVLGDETERTTITGAGTPITGNTWVGLSDLAAEGTFVWVTAESTGGYPMVGMRPPWAAGEPNNMMGNEDCVRFKNDYTLEDKPCADKQSYVCECDAFPPN